LSDPTLPELRSKVYKILSLCFIYPDEESFTYMSEKMSADLEGFLARMPHRKKLTSLGAFRSAIHDEVNQGTIQDLQVTYTSMFISPQPEIPCPPYESMYVNSPRRAMGPSTSDVIRRYASFKLSLSANFKDLPDHIGVELEFMHHLAHLEASAASEGNDKDATSLVASEKAFLGDHLSKWFPHFADCIESRSSSQLLVALSRLTREFVTEDSNYLANVRLQS
jgi:DMSO reductase family type II enzyme chaperone